MPIHNEAKLDEIAKTVIMPGDPMRAKYIAENFLEEYKLVNKLRGMYAYTGKYKEKEITVMASGMGMPSMGIYAYELYKFYNVENIIRIGSCGGYSKDLKILDIILVDNAYTEANFAKSMSNLDIHIVKSSEKINCIIEETAKNLSINYVKGNVTCTEHFDQYVCDPMIFVNKLPKEYNILAAEMESFALLYTAKYFEKSASCILTVSDSICEKKELTPEQRENSMNEMIRLALESSIKV